MSSSAARQVAGSGDLGHALEQVTEGGREALACRDRCVDMAVGGMAVDPVTISREACRRGIRVMPAELSAGTGIQAEGNAREVCTNTVLAQIGHSGAQVQAGAASSLGTMSELGTWQRCGPSTGWNLLCRVGQALRPRNSQSHFPSLRMHLQLTWPTP